MNNRFYISLGDKEDKTSKGPGRFGGVAGFLIFSQYLLQGLEIGENLNTILHQILCGKENA